MDKTKFLVFLSCVFVFMVLFYNREAIVVATLNATDRGGIWEETPRNKSSKFAPYPQDLLTWELAKASMPNKTVILTSVNAAWMKPNGIFDLFMKSFHEGEGTEPLLSHLLVVAMDEEAYSRCVQVHRHCYRLMTPGVDFSGEKTFMTQDYLKMTHRKILFLKNVIDRGYNFLFSDADVLWFRNPFQRLSNDSDIEISSDRYHGNPYDMTTQQNTGFMFFRSNERTVRVFNLWNNTALTRPSNHDQDILTEVKLSSGFRALSVKVRFLDTLYFSGFCEAPGDLKVVCTMHANCCKGLTNKVHDLREALEDWTFFRSSTGWKGHWRVRNQCVHSFGHTVQV